MDLLLIKVLLAVGIALIGLLGARLSFRAGASDRGEWYLTLGNATAGGIFLGAALMHMAPDSQEHLRQAFASDFAWAGLLIGLGFLIVMVPERVAFARSNFHEAGSVAPAHAAGFAGYMLATVLSLHSLIVGLSFGLETKPATLIGVIVAILAHKGTAAFALAAVLQQSGLARRIVYKLIGIFVAMTPLGMVVGALVSSGTEGRAAILIEGIFDGLAAGTFLYIAALEIIHKVFQGARSAWLKYALLLLGFAFMAVLSIWT